MRKFLLFAICVAISLTCAARGFTAVKGAKGLAKIPTTGIKVATMTKGVAAADREARAAQRRSAALANKKFPKVNMPKTGASTYKVKSVDLNLRPSIIGSISNLNPPTSSVEKNEPTD